MRLMLGDGSTPSLLVTVDDDYDPLHFKFHVINGEWSGEFFNGKISVFGPPSGDFTSLEPVKIMCDNQDRLRTVPWYDYQTAFNNFDNPDYIAPKSDKYITQFDDDIPF